MNPQQWSSASLPVLALVCGLPSRVRSLRDLFVLQCFVDESGNGHGPVMVMAGLIADVDSWARFSDDWQECLDMRPRLDSLHMAEFFAASWGDESQDRVRRFHRIIGDHVQASVIVSIPLDDYRTIFGGTSIWKNPYLFLFFRTVLVYRANCEQFGLSRKISFIFDTQIGAIARIAEAWEFFASARPDLRALVGGMPTFADDTSLLPLQAADMLAWWVRRSIAADVAGQERIDPPWTKDAVPCIRLAYDADGLRREYRQMFEAETG